MKSKLKPKTFEIFPVYECPKCEAEHSDTLEYTRLIGKFLCGCGHVLNVEAIGNVDCITDYNMVSKPIHPDAEQDNRASDIQHEASSALVELGWGHSEAGAVVKRLWKEYRGSAQDFAEYVLREAHAQPI